MGISHGIHERLRSLEGTKDIKVITGMRRSGKSELMKAFAREAAERDPSSNNVYLDLLDLDNEELLEYHALHGKIEGSYRDGVRNRLFIDEIQQCEGFERAINSIHARGGWDIYLTGSNAFLLNSDLATLFTGRHREIHILPFSFLEYREYFGAEHPVDDDFDDSSGMVALPDRMRTATWLNPMATFVTSTRPYSLAISYRNTRSLTRRFWSALPST